MVKTIAPANSFLMESSIKNFTIDFNKRTAEQSKIW